MSLMAEYMFTRPYSASEDIYLLENLNSIQKMFFKAR